MKIEIVRHEGYWIATADYETEDIRQVWKSGPSPLKALETLLLEGIPDFIACGEPVTALKSDEKWHIGDK